jgi:hypothetical protein
VPFLEGVLEGLLDQIQFLQDPAEEEVGASDTSADSSEASETVASSFSDPSPLQGEHQEILLVLLIF